MTWDHDTFPISPGGRVLDPFDFEYVDDLYVRYQEWFYKVPGKDHPFILNELLMFLAHVTPVTDMATIQEWGRERRGSSHG